jgi:hypothetical protein
MSHRGGLLHQERTTSPQVAVVAEQVLAVRLEQVVSQAQLVMLITQLRLAQVVVVAQQLVSVATVRLAKCG